MIAPSNPAPRTIQVALGSYSVTATYTGPNTHGDGNSRPSTNHPAPEAPTLSPGPGQYKLPQLISIVSATPGAILYYAINDGAPRKYTKPFPLRGSGTIEAVAIIESNGTYVESPVVTASYTAIVPPPPPPVLSPAGGTFTSPQRVAIQSASAGETVYYSINGGAAQRYTEPIRVAASATIEAVAIGSFGSLFAESPVVIGAFEILS